MAKIKPIYYIGAAALAAYFFRDKLFGAKSQPDGEIMPTEAAQPDAVIDTQKTGQSVSQAIETAKQIAQGVQDIKVLVKTPKGQKDITLTKGKKKPKKKRRLFKRRKKAKIYVGPTESSFTPFTSPASQESSYAPGSQPAFLNY